MIAITANTISALRTARAQCLIRVVQLSGCRTCGNDQARFELAVAELDKLMSQLENSDDIQIISE